MEKKIITAEELETLRTEFASLTIPESLQLDKSIFIPHVEHTVKCLFDQASLYSTNPNMQGYVSLLRRIVAKLKEENGSSRCSE
ncbi:MAG: DUF6965 family protein [Phocaeicola plebeius]